MSAHRKKRGFAGTGSEDISTVLRILPSIRIFSCAREHRDWRHFSFLGFERVIRRVNTTPAKVDTAPRRMERPIITGGKDNSTFIVGSVGK